MYMHIAQLSANVYTRLGENDKEISFKDIRYLVCVRFYILPLHL